MASKTRRRLTDEEREERQERERELVAKAVEELRSSEGWQQWLTTRSRFHKYSFGNQVLIALQNPDAVFVAGFKKWISLGYLCRKGESIKIWAPIPPSKRMIEEARSNEDAKRPRTFFKLVPVWGDNGVSELPPPAEPKPIRPPIAEPEGDSLAPAWMPLIVLAKTLGATVALEHMKDVQGGYLMPATKHIGINEDHSVNAKVKTLIHELAHLLVRVDRQEGDPQLDYDSEELVVESVAMSVAGSLGLDASAYSIPYLTSWSEDVSIDVLEAHAKLVNRLAARIESSIPEEVMA